MRRTLASLAVAAVAVATLGMTAPANAVCGGDGDPCTCNGELDLGKLGTYRLYYC